ncbi:MAG: DUF2953 domain-containing protein [Intestinimonas sp.]|jgi:hypothetical protein|nr:DUF2953 domain-containing protein [Intestinimonas sp.]
MNALLVFFLVLAVLWLLSLLRLGAEVRYSEEGVRLRLRVGRLWFTLLPRPKKPHRTPKNEKPEKEKAKTPPKPAAPRRVPSLALLREALSVICDAAGSLRRKIQIDHLDIDVTAAAPNPAAAALAFGGINAVMGMIIPPLENNFTIRERQFRTSVAYDRQTPVIDLRAAGSLTIGQGVALALRLAFRTLRIFRTYKKEQKKKEAV